MDTRKKIKIYPPAQSVRWIRELARARGIKPNEMCTLIVREALSDWRKRLLVFTPKEVEAAARVPEIKVEISFYADPALEEAWEYFKIRHRITSDAQAGRMIVRRRYVGDAAPASGQMQLSLDLV